MSLTTSANVPREGEIIAGKYVVERVLGAGGMGVVVAARHVQLETRVAIKFLLPEMLGSPEVVARFAREARAAVKITSENVARVLDVGTLETGAPYMVMEYLEGGDLAAMLVQHGALPIEQAVDFVLQACVAVADAHALGIVHRDLKPANLFCIRRTDGQLAIKVLDFGISKTIDAGNVSSSSFTRTSAMMGSPLYMSPEQMRTPKDVDTRADLWALGMILFELLAGRPAFQADTMTELVVQVTTEAAPPIRTFRPDVPEGLEAVILRCLEKDRKQRFQNVAELAVALLPFAPKRARAAVERISGIIQAAGLSASAIAMPLTPLMAGAGVSAATGIPVSHSAASLPGVSPRQSVTLVVALVVTVAVLVGAGFAVRAVLAGRQPPAAAAGVVQSTSATPTPSATPSPSDSTATPTATPSDSTAAAAPPPTTTATPTPTSTPSKPRPRDTATPSAGKGAPNCNPSYYYDTSGTKHYKPECFTH